MHIVFCSIDRQENNIRTYHECEGGIEKSVSMITRDGFFYPILTQIMYSFSCSPLKTVFHI